MTFLFICIVAYVCIVVFTVFFATLFRNIGPTIPVVMMTLMFLYIGAMVVGLMDTFDVSTGVVRDVFKIFDPLYCLSAFDITESGYAQIDNGTFVTAICSNLVYIGIFFAGGALIFSKRDVK